MERYQTNSFSVRSGVRQGCILSPILFNIALDYIMRQTTHNAQHGKQWTLFSQLEDLEYADDNALLSTTANHLQKKAHLLTENASKTGLQINQKKTKVMGMNFKERPQIKFDEEELEVVTDFTYLGSNISVENSVQKDISARINKERNSYCSLRNICQFNVHSIKIKMRLFNSNVISVLLYGCQSWRVDMNDMHKLDVFQTKCLRRICSIFWPNKISNEDLYRRTNYLPISCQIQKHRMRWLGHVLRMSSDHIPRVATRWTPAEKRSKGRPRTTWRRSIIAELSNMGLTMGEAKVIAQDRKRRRNDIMALCPTWG